MGDLNDDQLSMTRNAPSDLDWDYSAHEASPLLRAPRNISNNNVQSSVKLSNRQLDYLLDNIEEVRRILMCHSNDYSPLPRHSIHFNKLFFFIPIIFSILHVSAVTIDSFFTFQSLYFIYITTPINALLLIIYQVLMVVNRDRLPSLQHLTISSLLLTFLFSSLYTLAHLHEGETSFWLIYFRCMHSSISVATFNYNGQISQNNFWSLILLSLQMIMSLIHFLFIISSLIRWMSRRVSSDDDDEGDDDSYQNTLRRGSRQ